MQRNISLLFFKQHKCGDNGHVASGSELRSGGVPGARSWPDKGGGSTRLQVTSGIREHGLGLATSSQFAKDAKYPYFRVTSPKT